MLDIDFSNFFIVYSQSNWYLYNDNMTRHIIMAA